MKERYSLKQFILLILFAFLFSVVARMYWVYMASDIEAFKFNGEFIIHTYDGFTFAEGARDLLQGFHQPNDLSKIWDSLAQFTYVLNKILPLPFETIMFYMSIFLSSLIVIPMMLIARDLNIEKEGFIASLLASIANSYYIRTMAGRFDTDMLVIVLSVFVLWAIVHVNIKKDFKSLVFVPICILVMKWWYPQSYSLMMAFGVMFLGFTVVFDRKSPILYQAIALAFIASSNFSFYPKFALIVLILALALKFKEKMDVKKSLLLVILSFVIIFFSGGFDPIIYQLKSYVIKKDGITHAQTLHFFDVSSTIIEAKNIDINRLAFRISGSMAVFVLSIFGFLVLCWKKRVMLLSLPMVGLGFLSLVAGLRFTIYAVPIMAFGFGFFATVLVGFLFRNREKLGFLGNLIIASMVVLALYPMGKHIYIYKSFPAMTKGEATALDNLKKISSREDYIISWWDYGYPIRYYSDVKTLIDGGKHLGEDNFPVSFMFLKDSISSSNMAKLAVKYTENSYKTKNHSILPQMLKDYNQSDINIFLNSLKDENFKTPKLDRDIFFYFPKRMAITIPTIAKFSRLDLKSGEKLSQPTFIVGVPRTIRKDGYVDIGNNILIQRNGRHIYFGNTKRDINTMAVIQNGKTRLISLDSNSNIYLIFSVNYKQFVILDKELFDSVVVQMGLLGLYDETRYEKIIDKDSAKIYKLK